MKKIAIVAGEPNSINSEIIGKSWTKIKHNKKIFFVIGNFLLIKKQLEKKKIKVPLLKKNSIDEISSSKKLQIIDIPLNFKNPYKVKKTNSAVYVLKSINLAHELSINKKILGFINCAIDKSTIFKHNTGVTEFLAKKNKIIDSEAMLIYNKNLAVVPLTTHIPLKNIAKKISVKLIEKKTTTISKYYKKLFNIKPTIAILGLNPHNSEFSINSEESKIIIPAIKKLRKKGHKVIGPFPADTVFNNKKKYKYNVVLGMYHDQVLAPFKALFNFNAINITLGLKYIRVSPDHGTAKDIMKFKKASPVSLIESIDFFQKLDNE